MNEITGSGKDGRILKEDVLKYIELQKSGAVSPAQTSDSSVGTTVTTSAPAAAAAQRVAPQQVPTFTAARNLGVDKKEAIKGMRKVMVKTMTQANAIPHFSYCDEYNLNALVELREQIKTSVARERGISFSYMPFFIKVR